MRYNLGLLIGLMVGYTAFYTTSYGVLRYQGARPESRVQLHTWYQKIIYVLALVKRKKKQIYQKSDNVRMKLCDSLLVRRILASR